MTEGEGDSGEVHSFIWTWFGFDGWKELATSKRIGAQILYRLAFVTGLAVLLVLYVSIMGEDPSILPLLGIFVGWFLIFQLMMNFIFTAGSR